MGTKHKSIPALYHTGLVLPTAPPPNPPPLELNCPLIHPPSPLQFRATPQPQVMLCLIFHSAQQRVCWVKLTTSYSAQQCVCLAKAATTSHFAQQCVCLAKAATTSHSAQQYVRRAKAAVTNKPHTPAVVGLCNRM